MHVSSNTTAQCYLVLFGGPVGVNWLRWPDSTKKHFPHEEGRTMKCILTEKAAAAIKSIQTCLFINDFLVAFCVPATHDVIGSVSSI